MSDATVIKLCDVINQALAKGAPPLSDHEIFADCKKCGHVPLSSCNVTQGAETTYTCQCGDRLVIISGRVLDAKPWPGRGYRVHDFVVRNAVDFFYRGVRVLLCEHALAPERS